MNNSVSNKVIRRIKSNKRGWVFTPKDFLDLGTSSNVDFVLYQLVQKQLICRIGRG